jgi:hypothetical protein
VNEWAAADKDRLRRDQSGSVIDRIQRSRVSRSQAGAKDAQHIHRCSTVVGAHG